MFLPMRVFPVFKSKRMVCDKFFVVKPLLMIILAMAVRSSFCPGRLDPFISFDTGNGKPGFNLNQFSPVIGPSPPEWP